MRAPCLVCLVCFAGTLLFAQQRLTKPASPHPGSVEHFSVVDFHNSEITVRKLDIPAGASETVSAAVHDYLLVSLDSNSLRVTGYQTDFQLDFASGDVQVLQGGWPHKLQNQSAHVAELLQVEVAGNLFPKSAVCGLVAANCGEIRFGKSAEGEYKQATLFETDTAKLFRDQLDAQVTMHQHDDGRPHLLIALSAFEGHADDGNFTLQPRETYWHLGSIHEIGNDGSAPARFLILELKKKY